MIEERDHMLFLAITREQNVIDQIKIYFCVSFILDVIILFSPKSCKCEHIFITQIIL